MAVIELNHQQHKYMCLSTDTKPTAATAGVTTGSTCYVYTIATDLLVKWITYDGTNWVIQDENVSLTTITGDSITDDTADAIKARLVDASGTALEKAEDAAHASGDKGIMSLGVRKDAPVSLAGTDGDYVSPQFDNMGNQRVVNSGVPMFGEPSLVARNNGSASWAKTGVSPLDQKSATGWLANLYGGVQSGWDDYARVEIPVNEMKVTDLSAAMWSYYMTEAETFGINMVIWVHDPTDFDKRAEITQQADIATLIKAAGWNAHVLSTSVAQFYFYGEGESGNDVCTTEGPPNYYTWAQYQSDAMFSTWTIYRISFEYGWQTGDNEFKDAWVADIKINGQLIPLKPDSGGSGRFKRIRATATSGAIAVAFAPQTPFKDLSVMLHLAAVATTAANLTINVDAGADALYDTNLLTIAMVANAVTNLVVKESGPFMADDVIDVDWANADGTDYGITVSVRTVFDV